MTFAGEYADKTRGAASWGSAEPRPRALTLQGVPCADDRGDGRATAPKTPSLDRRHEAAEPSFHVIACVDVKSSALTNGHYVTSEVLRGLAVRRMERCIRPSDRVCMLGASRLAVCFGHGSHRIAPSELGTRLARAMGDHLTVGSTTLDLRVTVGVGAGTIAVEPSDLIGAAIASTRSPQNRVNITRPHSESTMSTVTVTQVPEPHELLRVTHGEGQPESTPPPVATRTAGAAATTHRLLRRTSFRHVDPMVHNAGINAVRMGRQSSDVDRFPSHSRVAGLTILVVDPAVALSDTPRSAVQGVAAAARRLGVCPILSAADRPDTVVDDLSVSEADAVVLILHPDAARSLNGVEGGTPWEHPARLARALVDAGASVIALSVGATAAGVAACVEQGAAGLLHIDALADELVTVAKLSAAKASGTTRPTGNGSGSGASGSQRGRRLLPAPFDSLVHLTSTERKVLFHMMEGRAAGEIASELVVSLTTVRSHIRSILRKLNVNSQLAAVAIANGAYPRTAALG